MKDGRKRIPSAIGDILADVLEDAGLSDRVAQASVFPEWSALVGRQIAAVAEPVALYADGTLVVATKTNAWMMELSLMEPELLRSINRDASRPPVRKLRFVLHRTQG
jgi:predicted nucleic acid-binding Zn ribbon protein